LLNKATVVDKSFNKKNVNKPWGSRAEPWRHVC